MATADLEGKSVNYKKELLSQMGIDYDDLPSWQKMGIGIYYVDVEKEGYNPITNTTVLTKRRELLVDYELPTGEEYRNYILRVLDEV